MGVFLLWTVEDEAGGSNQEEEEDEGEGKKATEATLGDKLDAAAATKEDAEVEAEVLFKGEQEVAKQDLSSRSQLF